MLNKLCLELVPRKKVHESVVCVGVECAKTCCFVTDVITGGILHQTGPKMKKLTSVRHASPRFLG